MSGIPRTNSHCCNNISGGKLFALILSYTFVVSIVLQHSLESETAALFVKLLVSGMVIFLCLLRFAGPRLNLDATGPKQMLIHLFDPPLMLLLTVSSSIFTTIISSSLTSWPYMMRGGAISFSKDSAWIYVLFHLLTVFIATWCTLKKRLRERVLWCTMFLFAANGACFKVDPALLWGVLMALVFTILDDKNTPVADKGHLKPLIPLGLFALCCLVALLRSPYFYGSYRYFANLSFCCLFFIFVYFSLRTGQDAKHLVYGLVFTGAVVFVSFLYSDIRTMAYGVNIFKTRNLHLGALGLAGAQIEFYALFVLPMLLAITVVKKGTIRALTGSIFIFCLFRLLFCGFRKVFFTVPLWLTIFLLLSYFCYIKKKGFTGFRVRYTKTRVIIVILLAVLLSSLILYQTSDMYSRLLATLSATRTMPRITGWIYAGKIVRHCFWFGNGLDAHYSLGRLIDFELTPRAVIFKSILPVFLRTDFHNFFIETVEYSGLLSLICLLIFLGYLFFTTVRSLQYVKDRELLFYAIGALSGSTVYFVSTMLHRPRTYIHNIPLELWILLALMWFISTKYSRHSNTVSRNNRFITCAGSIVVTIFVLTAGIFPVINQALLARISASKPGRSDKKIQRFFRIAHLLEPANDHIDAVQGDWHLKAGNIQQGLDAYLQAIDKKKFFSPYLSKAGRIALYLKDYPQAEHLFRQSVAADPCGVSAKNNSMELVLSLVVQGKKREAVTCLARAITMGRSSFIYQYWRKMAGAEKTFFSYWFDPAINKSLKTETILSHTGSLIKLKSLYIPDTDVLGKPINLAAFESMPTVYNVTDDVIGLGNVVQNIEQDIERWKTTDPDQAKHLMIKLIVLSKNMGLYTEALRYVDRYDRYTRSLSSKNISISHVHLIRGKILACQGKYATALEEIEKWKGGSRKPTLHEMKLKRILGQDIELVKLIAYIKDEDHMREEPYLLMASAALAEKDYPKAIEAYQQCRLRSKPRDINNYIRYTEAIATFYNFLKVQEKSRKALRESIIALARLNKRYDPSWNSFLQRTANYMVASYARDKFPLTISLDSECSHMEHYLDQEMAQMYLAYFSVSLFQKHYFDLVEEGKGLCENEQYQAAVKVFQNASTLLQKYPLSHYYTAHAFGKTGSGDEAAKYWKKFRTELRTCNPEAAKEESP